MAKGAISQSRTSKKKVDSAATHLLARASYLCDYPLWERMEVDELREFLPSRPD